MTYVNVAAKLERHRKRDHTKIKDPSVTAHNKPGLFVPMVNHSPSSELWQKYQLNCQYPISPAELELYCFGVGHSPEHGGLGKFEHFRNAASLFWPKLQWNPWMEKQIQSLCDHRFVGWAGCGASGKTYSATLYAMLWWAFNPLESSVILTSTTAKMIRKRQWAALQELFNACQGFPGHMVDSKTTLQATKGDDKHGIFALPVLEGSTSKAAANIQGVHSKRILVVLDEATDVPEAIVQASSNLAKGCDEFQMLMIGNPHSYFDQHGRFCEPKAGWRSVNVEVDEWETKRGICVRFDGMKSPNIREGRSLWPYLITAENVRSASEFEGVSSPTFWKYTRGFWSPEGISATVLSETMCLKFNVQQSAAFYSRALTIAGLDPAFTGGDRCVLRFARFGDRSDGFSTVLFEDIVIIKPDANSSEPIAYQIARRVREECESRGCAPEHLAVDSTGNGAGLCDILNETWSTRIRRVSFGTVASDIPASQFDDRPAKSAYKNRVTELWYSIREWVKSDQVRGLDPETIIELCSRNYIEEDRKIILESKIDMKARFGRSPDLGDAAALVIDVARALGGYKLAPGGASSQFAELLKQSQTIYHEDNLYAEADA
jgi:hypothetical protein